jgi:hypothetical protein
MGFSHPTKNQIAPKQIAFSHPTKKQNPTPSNGLFSSNQKPKSYPIKWPFLIQPKTK